MAKITAISSLGWTHYTLYEALPMIKKMGFDRIDIASFYDYSFHFNYGSPVPLELKDMLERESMDAICINYAPEYYHAWHDGAEDRFVNAYEAKMPHLNIV